MRMRKAPVTILLYISTIIIGVCTEEPDRQTIYFNATLSTRMGHFSSPEYPEPYPPNILWTYVFHGELNDRIKIQFKKFDLDQIQSNVSSSGCRMDYVDIYVVDLKTETKQFEKRLCGNTLPNVYISVHQQLELVFGVRARKQQHGHIGFTGTYKFVDEDWQPYNISSKECGETFIEGPGGSIKSPNYPDHYPAKIECTWMIRVRNDERILLNVIDLNLGPNVACEYVYVSIWNGFASPIVEPEKTVCGKLYFYEHKMIEFKSTHFRVVIRFVSTGHIEDRNRGFHIAWAAYTPAREYYSNGRLTELPCPSATCEGGEFCLDDAKLLCNPLDRYCIDESLICDGVVNCGAFDHSDEEGCVLKIVLIAVAVIAPIALVAAIPVIYIRLKRRRRIRRAEAKLREDYNMRMNATTDYHDVIHTPDNDTLREMRRTSTSPPKRLAAPGYIAVFSPSKQGYAVYDEFNSGTYIDERQSCDLVRPPLRNYNTAPLPPVRTCTMVNQSSPIAAPRKAICSSGGGGGGVPPTPPESDYEFELYTTIHNPSVTGREFLKNGYTTSQRVNNSVSVTV